MAQVFLFHDVVEPSEQFDRIDQFFFVFRCVHEFHEMAFSWLYDVSVIFLLYEICHRKNLSGSCSIGLKVMGLNEE
jgi:hypothetical protein